MSNANGVNMHGLIADGSSGAPELEDYIAREMQKAFTIFKERQAKYGSGNIARRGPVGVLVRLDDKLARLDRVFMEGAADAAADESVEDTCLDIANYALILLACHAGAWPGWTEKRPEGTGRPSPLEGALSGGSGLPTVGGPTRQVPGWWRNDTNRPTTP